MTRADIARLSQEYPVGEPREGRLARALQVEIPVWRQLGDEILGDLDEHVFGVGWWAPGPGTSRRILISDHLCNCVRSVETNLIEARLHLIEATDFWERESDLYARAVSINADETLQVEMPERRRPLDEITSAMGILHTIGFIRAIAGALDCFGASVVGVVALRANLLRADLDSARRTLAAVAGAGAAERLQGQFGTELEALIGRGGPAGWFRWVMDLRNTLIHRGRRLQMSELRPVSSGIVGLDGRPFIRTDVIHQLPRDPGRSDVEMFLDAAHAPVLTESAATTLRGVLENSLQLIGEGGGLLHDVWRARRSHPALLPQPREQWPAGPSGVTAGFEGYAPGSMPYNPAQLRADATFVRRMAASSLGDAAREAWANFD
jgi:hypothetical protein